MLTKVRTNPGAYDVVLINSARDAQAKADGLIDPIDFAGVPNAAGLAPAFRTNPNILISGKTYGVPWVWGMNTLAVRTGKGLEADSYAVFDEPRRARGALRRRRERDRHRGADDRPGHQRTRRMKKISDTLKGFKKSVKLVWSSEDEWDKAFAADAFDVSVFWAGAVTRAVNLHHQPVSFVIPKEGAVGWLDNLCIPASSTNKVSIIPAALASDSTSSQRGPAVIRCPFRDSQGEAELAVAITRTEFDAAGLRHAAARAKDADAARRMLALALVLDGRTRTEAAQTCGMDRQTLRDWVHRHNVEGLAGLSDRKAPGPTPRLSAEQQAEVTALVRSGPDQAEHGIVRCIWSGGALCSSVASATDRRSAASERQSVAVCRLGAGLPPDWAGPRCVA